MSNTVRLRLIVIIAVVASAATIGLTAFAFQRAAVLQSLRLDTDTALQSVYRLSNTTFRLLFTADDLEETETRWREEYDTSFRLIDELAFHPGLDIVDEDPRRRVRQTRSLWTISTNGFTAGAEQLERLLASDLPENTAGNLSDVISDLQDEMRRPESDPAVGDLLFAFQQVFFQIEATNEGFEFFTTSALDQLKEEVQTATVEAIRTTVITALSLAVVILAMVLAALIASIRLLHRANRGLEERVAERTRSIQQLLDFSGEGFLTFGSDRRVHAEISRECQTIFGRDVVGADAAELFFADPEKREDFKQAMELVFSGDAGADVVFDIVDSTITVNGKIVDLSLRLVDEQTVMCVLHDVTTQQELERKVAEQQAKREMVLRIVTARPHFLGLLEDGDDLFAALESHVVGGQFSAGDKEYPPLIRALHTFKSNAAFLRMEATSAAAHDLETALEDAHVMEDVDPVGPALAAFRRAYNDDVAYVSDALGETWTRDRSMQEVDGIALRRIYHHVVQEHGDDVKLVRDLDRIARLPLAGLFSRMAELVGILAATRGKQIDVSTDDRQIMVHAPVYQALSDALNHLIRNMVDHGIELPRHREKAGKPPMGHVTFSARRSDGRLHITLTDDGAGIDVERVVANARERGLAVNGRELSPQDVVRMVFSEGVTTATATTATSGRGVGLAAVRRRIKDVSGTINLSTKRGRGTQFTFIIPDMYS